MDSSGLIDEFCDALWLEDGLASNTLEAYRRDLSQFATWLDARHGKKLSSILASCARSIGQHRHVMSNMKWRITDNLEDAAPWTLITSVGAVAFLLLSLFYERTIGPLVKWIRTGSW